jgi:hypothetical protein
MFFLASHNIFFQRSRSLIPLNAMVYHIIENNYRIQADLVVVAVVAITKNYQNSFRHDNPQFLSAT